MWGHAWRHCIVEVWEYCYLISLKCEKWIHERLFDSGVLIEMDEAFEMQGMFGVGKLNYDGKSRNEELKPWAFKFRVHKHFRTSNIHTCALSAISSSAALTALRNKVGSTLYRPWRSSQGAWVRWLWPQTSTLYLHFMLIFLSNSCAISLASIRSRSPDLQLSLHFGSGAGFVHQTNCKWVTSLTLAEAIVAYSIITRRMSTGEISLQLSITMRFLLYKTLLW